MFEDGEIETGFFKEWAILTDFWAHLDAFCLRGHGSVVEHWNNSQGSLAVPGCAMDMLHDLQPVICLCEAGPASLGHQKGTRAFTSFVASL